MTTIHYDDTRADWNARRPLRPLEPLAKLLGVSWHWIGPGKGPSASGPHSACLEQVRDWQAQHQAKGWKDIGYGALICKHARLIEGRGLLVQGSHSPGVNDVHAGVQLMTGEDGPPPSPAMLARAVVVRAELELVAGRELRDWGHRDDPEAQTECPGSFIEQWVRSGGPTTGADMTTPREIASDILGWETIPSDRIPFGTKRDAVPLRVAAGYTMLWSLQARDAADRCEALLRAFVEKGTALTPADVEAALDRALDRRILDADVDLTVTPPAATPDGATS